MFNCALTFFVDIKTTTSPLSAPISPQVLPGAAAGLRPGLSDLRPCRGLGLPHGQRLLGQEVRLHVGRRQERHEGDGGSPGEKIFREESPLKLFYIFIFQKTADLTYSNEIPTSVYNPSGMYGLKVMGVSWSSQSTVCSSSKHGNNRPF